MNNPKTGEPYSELVVKVLVVFSLVLTIATVLVGMKFLANQQSNRDEAWLRAMSAWELEMRDAVTAVRPKDVLDRVNHLDEEISGIRTLIETKTEDRFRGSDFRAFLEANPDLQPPDNDSLTSD